MCEVGFSVEETVAAAVLPEQPAVELTVFLQNKIKRIETQNAPIAFLFLDLQHD